MRKVRMKATACGPNGNMQNGEVYDLADNHAGNLVQAGFAEYVDSPRESAAMERAETAAAPAPKKRQRKPRKVNKDG